MKFKRIRKIESLLSCEISKHREAYLKQLIGECQRLTTTNCCWKMYGLKDIVIEVARAQLRWLKIQKELRQQSQEAKDGN